MMSSNSFPVQTVNEYCMMCQGTYFPSQMIQLSCSHKFCNRCVYEAQVLTRGNLCPSCNSSYGNLRGPQPTGGSMTWTTNNAIHCPGYEGHGIILIHYYIPSGIQTNKHPHPGVPHEGTSRSALLPNTELGQKVCGLLKQAFDAGLIFKVGRSLTTGRDDVIVWADIPHKTSFQGEYGYPDPEYLPGLEFELKARLALI